MAAGVLGLRGGREKPQLLSPSVRGWVLVCRPGEAVPRWEGEAGFGCGAPPAPSWLRGTPGAGRGGSAASYPLLPLPPAPLNYSPRCGALMNYGAQAWCLLATCSLIPPPAPSEPPGPSPAALRPLCPAEGLPAAPRRGWCGTHGCSPPPPAAPKPLAAARAARHGAGSHLSDPPLGSFLPRCKRQGRRPRESKSEGRDFPQ